MFEKRVKMRAFDCEISRCERGISGDENST